MAQLEKRIGSNSEAIEMIARRIGSITVAMLREIRRNSNNVDQERSDEANLYFADQERLDRILDMMATQFEAQSTAMAQLEKRIGSNTEAIEMIARRIGSKTVAMLREIRRNSNNVDQERSNEANLYFADQERLDRILDMMATQFEAQSTAIAQLEKQIGSNTEAIEMIARRIRTTKQHPQNANIKLRLQIQNGEIF